MPRQSDAASGTMVELIGRAIAGADGTDSQADADRYRHLAREAYTSGGCHERKAAQHHGY